MLKVDIYCSPSIYGWISQDGGGLFDAVKVLLRVYNVFFKLVSPLLGSSVGNRFAEFVIFVNKNRISGHG